MTDFKLVWPWCFCLSYCVKFIKIQKNKNSQTKSTQTKFIILLSNHRKKGAPSISRTSWRIVMFKGFFSITVIRWQLSVQSWVCCKQEWLMVNLALFSKHYVVQTFKAGLPLERKRNNKDRIGVRVFFGLFHRFSCW